MKQEMLEYLNRHFQELETNKLFVLATILNPKINFQWINQLNEY